MGGEPKFLGVVSNGNPKASAPEGKALQAWHAAHSAPSPTNNLLTTILLTTTAHCTHEDTTGFQPTQKLLKNYLSNTNNPPQQLQPHESNTINEDPN